MERLERMTEDCDKLDLPDQPEEEEEKKEDPIDKANRLFEEAVKNGGKEFELDNLTIKSLN